MRKLLGLTLALTAALIPITESILSSPALAGKAQWVKIWDYDGKSGSDLYVDKASIKRNGKFRSFWTFLKLNKPYRGGGFTSTAYYLKGYETVDCQAKSVRDGYSAWLGYGYKVVYQSLKGENKFNKIDPSLKHIEVINFVCFPQKKSNYRPSTVKRNSNFP